MTVVEQEVDPVFLVPNRVVLTGADDFDVLDVDFVAKLGPLVLGNLTGDVEAGFLVQVVLGQVEGCFIDVVLSDDSLEEAGTVPQLQEGDLTTGPLVRQPDTDFDGFANMFR